MQEVQGSTPGIDGQNSNFYPFEVGKRVATFTTVSDCCLKNCRFWHRGIWNGCVTLQTHMCVCNCTHSYVSDTRLYASCRPNVSTELQCHLSECVNDIASWMRSNRLPLRSSRPSYCDVHQLVINTMSREISHSLMLSARITGILAFRSILPL